MNGDKQHTQGLVGKHELNEQEYEEEAECGCRHDTYPDPHFPRGFLVAAATTHVFLPILEL